MYPLEEAAVMVGLFLIRLGIPLAITILVTWALRRLDSRWQAEAELREINDRLEQQVKIRTSELSDTIQLLQR